MNSEKIIKITSGDVKVTAKLNNSKTAQELWENLPIENGANIWGDEIYFSIPINASEEQEYSKETVELGDVGFWPQGNAICFFFGPTPASTTPDEIRPASNVNVIGKIQEDPTILKQVFDEDEVKIDRND